VEVLWLAGMLKLWLDEEWSLQVGARHCLLIVHLYPLAPSSSVALNFFPRWLHERTPVRYYVETSSVNCRDKTQLDTPTVREGVASQGRGCGECVPVHYEQTVKEGVARP